MICSTTEKIKLFILLISFAYPTSHIFVRPKMVWLIMYVWRPKNLKSTKAITFEKLRFILFNQKLFFEIKKYINLSLNLYKYFQMLLEAELNSLMKSGCPLQLEVIDDRFNLFLWDSTCGKNYCPVKMSKIDFWPDLPQNWKPNWVQSVSGWR